MSLTIRVTWHSVLIIGLILSLLVVETNLSLGSGGIIAGPISCATGGLTKCGIFQCVTVLSCTIPFTDPNGVNDPFPLGTVGCSNIRSTNCIHVIAGFQTNQGPIPSIGQTHVERIINPNANVNNTLYSFTAFSASTELSRLLEWRENTNFWGNGQGSPTCTQCVFRLVANHVFGGTCASVTDTFLTLKYASVPTGPWNTFNPTITVDLSLDDGTGSFSVGTGVDPVSLPGDVYLSLFVSGGDNVSTCNVTNVTLEIALYQTVPAANCASDESYTITRTQFIYGTQCTATGPVSWLAWIA